MWENSPSSRGAKTFGTQVESAVWFDAVGLLRTGMRSNNPTIFFEHRNPLDAKYTKKPYPGDKFVFPFGKGNKLQEGDEINSYLGSDVQKNGRGSK